MRKTKLAGGVIHLLTNDLFDLAYDALCRRKERENTVCHVFHITAAHHQCVALDYTVLRRVFEALTKHICNLHAVHSFLFLQPPVQTGIFKLYYFSTFLRKMQVI